MALVGCSINGELFKLDELTGVGTLVGAIGFNVLNSLADDSTGALYSVSGGTPLVRINAQTAAGTFVKHLQPRADIRALAFSPGNFLFGIRNGSDPVGAATPDELVTIDVTTGVVTLVGNTGKTAIQALDFAPNGTLYAWDVNVGLLTINPVTGVASVVNPGAAPGTVADIQSLAFAPDGTLFGGRDSLFKIDVSNGAATLIGSGGYADLRGIAFLKGERRRPPIIRIAWLWTILIGYILITPIGPLCIVCGDPLDGLWIRALGLGTLGLAVVGLMNELKGSRV